MKSNDQIGSYRLIQRLDEGTGPGQWRGQSVDDSSMANLRIIDVGEGESNFVDHLTAVHALDHPRIHPIAGFGVHEGRYGWVATSAPPGTTLAARMAQDPSPYSEAVAIIGDVLQALIVAHEAGVYHGALKADAVVCAGDHWMLTNLGLNDLAPGAVLAVPGDDLKAVKELLRDVVPSPPPALRALLASGPSTAAAFLRALQILPVHSGRTTDRPRASTAQETNASAAATLAGWVDPVAPSQNRRAVEQPKETSPSATNDGDVLAPLDTWGVEPQSSPASWVDRDRELIKTSSASTGSSEASWGVRETGANLVPKDAHSPFSPSQKAALAVFLVTLLAGGIFLVRMSSEPAPADDAEEMDPNRADNTAAEGAAAEGGAQASEDAGRPEGVVDVTFSPVPVRVVRIRDGVVVCDKMRVCRLPIDVDYRAEHPGYKPTHVSGDDLYDRRHSGHWRLVLSPKPAPEPRRKRRRLRPSH